MMASVSKSTGASGARPADVTLFLLSAGAAKGLVKGLEEPFCERHNVTIDSAFGAVGAMRERLVAGAPCDVLVLTSAMLADLAKDGRVDGETIAPLGRVRTGIAVRSSDARPAVDSAEALRAALSGADAVYFPDPVRATAGIHFMNVLRALALDAELAPRLRPFPNGAAAMAALAASTEEHPIGCTQVTEILYTPGVALVDVLPARFELSTIYAAAVTTSATNRSVACALVDSLTGADAAQKRRQGGFEDA